jgi:hypothetical protein
VTRTPQFDDLVDDDMPSAERERLERMHDLLVTAGPPPELTPELAAGPTLAMSLAIRRRVGRQRRIALLAAAIALLAIAFVAGYTAGNNSGSAGGHALRLSGTKAAPGALASLVIKDADAAGNWPMQLSVTGLPPLPQHGYYEVYLTRHGKPFAPCGVFVVKSKGAATSVSLNAPYRLQKGDNWVVTRHLPGTSEPGAVVLHPLT